MLKIQSSNHFCGICLEYIILRPVYYFHIYNSGLVLVNSQNNLEADSQHRTTHVTDLSETYDMTPTQTKQLSTTRGVSCNISSFHWYIPSICLSYVISNLGFSCSTLAGLPSLPGGLCRFTPAPLADLLCRSHRETSNTRLWPAKVPQPSVDLIYMAASARSLERSISTAKFKVQTLSSCIFVRNGGSQVAIQEAWREWNPTENILNPANIESRNGGGLIKLSESILTPFLSMVPVMRSRRSSKAPKKTRQRGMSSDELLY